MISIWLVWIAISRGVGDLSKDEEVLFSFWIEGVDELNLCKNCLWRSLQSTNLGLPLRIFCLRLKYGRQSPSLKAKPVNKVGYSEKRRKSNTYVYYFIKLKQQFLEFII